MHSPHPLAHTATLLLRAGLALLAVTAPALADNYFIYATSIPSSSNNDWVDESFALANPGSECNDGCPCTGNGGNSAYNPASSTELLNANEMGSFSIPSGQVVVGVYVNTLVRFDNGTTNGFVRLRLRIPSAGVDVNRTVKVNGSTNCHWEFTLADGDVTNVVPMWTNATINDIQLGVRRETANTGGELKCNGLRVQIVTAADSDNDGTPDSSDQCPNDPAKVVPGTCGCNQPDTFINIWPDTDGDGCGNAGSAAIQHCAGLPIPPGYATNNSDTCPNNPAKCSWGTCGCTMPDSFINIWPDTDGDGCGNAGSAANQHCAGVPIPPGYATNNSDSCPNNPAKCSPGTCGCNFTDSFINIWPDTDGDGCGNAGSAAIQHCADLPVPPGYATNNSDTCPSNPAKCSPGTCGCSLSDVYIKIWPDTDGDGCGDPFGPWIQICAGSPIPPGYAPNESDYCPNDPTKCAWGACGCGVPDTDTDADGRPDCIDNCDLVANPDQANADGDGAGDACDGCPNDPHKTSPGVCGCGYKDLFGDPDGDGVIGCLDNCPYSFNQTQADGDADGIGDACDNCPVTTNWNQSDIDGDRIGDACDGFEFNYFEGGGLLFFGTASSPDGGVDEGQLDWSLPGPEGGAGSGSTGSGLVGAGASWSVSLGNNAMGTSIAVLGAIAASQPPNYGGSALVAVGDNSKSGPMTVLVLKPMKFAATWSYSGGGVVGFDGPSWNNVLLPGRHVLTLSMSAGVSASSVSDSASVDWALDALPLYPTGLPAWASLFEGGAESWTLADILPGTNTKVGTATVIWEPESGNLGGCIRGSDLTSNTSFFEAPSSFLGNKGAFIGGAITFGIRPSANGDPAGSVLTLAGGNGVSLFGDFEQPQPAWQAIVVPLEGVSFRVGSAAGPVASDAQLLAVLSQLVAFRISAEYDNGSDQTLLDSVIFLAPDVEPRLDTDGDGTPDSADGCPNDPGKTQPGACGCGVPDIDSDGDGVPNCVDQCPGVDDTLDCDRNGVIDCLQVHQPGADTNGNGIPDSCECPGDLNSDVVVNGVDLAIVLGGWGTCNGAAGDANADGCVNGVDLAIVLGGWGPCKCSGDLNGDKTVNGSDLALVLGGWGSCNGGTGDANADGCVNGMDIAIVLGGWGACK